ncbi:MAG: hypothetical protein ACLPSW_30930 [Roseiarcus sp.]
MSRRPEPLVKAVAEDVVRDRYYERIAEQADPAEDPAKRADRRRKQFVRAVKLMLDAKSLIAAKKDNRRLLWFLEAMAGENERRRGWMSASPYDCDGNLTIRSILTGETTTIRLAKRRRT